MTYPYINKETGEICGDLICANCNVNINRETGEKEVINGANKVTFKVVTTYNEKKNTKSNVKELEFCCEKSDRKYLILMMFLTLIMVVPAFGVTVWMIIETLLHAYSHRTSRNLRKVRKSLHRILFSEFCAFCQAERSMNVIGKLQDNRTLKMRQYVRNIPIGT